MESPDGIGDDEVDQEFPDQEFTPRRHEGDEVTSGDIIGTPSEITVSYPKPKDAKTPQQRADDLAYTIRNFRIAHAGDGLLRGNFGNLIDQFKNLQHQMENIQRSVDQFTLEGDDLNVSGSFDKGYTVERDKTHAHLRRNLPMDEVHEQIGTLEQRFQRFRIVGSPDVIIEGDIYHGYAVNVPQCGGVEAGAITGACCIGTDCTITTEQGCVDSGGVYQGNGTDCIPNPCEPIGACCFEDGSCTVETEFLCDSVGGTYQGDGTDYYPNPCGGGGETGACCADGDCSIVTEEECLELGGNYLGDDTTCEGVDCTQGACCDDDGNCTITTEAGCFGEYQGDGSTCEPNPCPQPCLCFTNPNDGQCYANKTVRAVATGSNPGGCDCTLEADWTSTFSCDLETGEVTPGCSGTWHRVVSLTPGHLCVPGDVTETWAFYIDRCGWNVGHADPIVDCCGGMGIPNPCGVADLTIFEENCSYTCCDAQPGCFQIDVTVTYF